MPGILSRVNSPEKTLALTFDACNGRHSDYDAALIETLVREQVPATLFITAEWIDRYPEIFRNLSANPLFEIENHGWKHKPCSVSGRSIYGLSGTRNAEEAMDEIEKNAEKIRELTGRRPLFYRSGGAYYDEVGLAMARELGYRVAGYSVSGDGGATFSPAEVSAELRNAPAGSVILLHMNRPACGTAAGVQAAIPWLKRRGYRFVRLAEVDLE